MLLSMGAYAQEQSEYSHVTEDLDTLYLDKDFALTWEIINIWKLEKEKGEKIPVIVTVDVKTLSILKKGLSAAIREEDVIKM